MTLLFRYPPRKTLSIIKNALKVLGFRSGFKFILIFFFPGVIFKSTVTDISIPDIKYLVKVRTKTSDILVLRQIFINKDYDIPLAVKPQLIIDAGANVGYAAIYFANQYPEAKIIAIEPEEYNYQMLKENTANYPNIKLVKAGIWNKDTWLKISNPESGNWQFMVEEIEAGDENAIKAVTIGEILKTSGFPVIDILKMDIEGAEKEVFSTNYEEWLDKVKILIIELHDRLKPGCSEAFYSGTSKYDFYNKINNGENLLLIKRQS
jgi:FkbM family methyltransferase